LGKRGRGRKILLWQKLQQVIPKVKHQQILIYMDNHYTHLSSRSRRN
jgi:hypothetical protein